MNLLLPVSSLMSRKIHIVEFDDNMKKVRDVFTRTTVLHLVVMKDEKVVGIINRSDFANFIYGLNKQFNRTSITQTMLEAYTAQEIMNGKISFIEANDRINVALEMLRDNITTALPVLDENEKLVGLVAALDILKALSKDKVTDLHFNIF